MPRSTAASFHRPAKPKDVDDYLRQLPDASRRVLQRLREQIRASAPEAEEVISYQVPTYRFHGPVVRFAAQPKHLSLTVISSRVLKAFAKELADFEVSGRTIHFDAKKPLPGAVVKRMLRMRMAEMKADPAPD